MMKHFLLAKIDYFASCLAVISPSVSVLVS